MEPAKTTYAICILREDGGSGASGVCKFVQEEGKQTRVIAEMRGLSAGLHGFHVHEFGNLIEGCKSAGAHFNPEGKEHAGPDDEIRHHGDMGNVQSEGPDKVSTLDYYDRLIQLSGPHSIVG